MGDWPFQTRLALPSCPVPGPVLGGQLQQLAGRQAMPAQARWVWQRGNAPSQDHSLEYPFLARLCLWVRGRKGVTHPQKVESGPGVQAGLAMPPTVLGGSPGRKQWVGQGRDAGTPEFMLQEFRISGRLAAWDLRGGPLAPRPWPPPPPQLWPAQPAPSHGC